MKKLRFPSAFLLAIIITSCKKDSSVARTGAAQAGSSSAIVAASSLDKIASPWFTPAFNIVNDRSSIYLMAQQDHETYLRYDNASHVELAFAKLDYRGIPLIVRLPVVLAASQANGNDPCQINFGLDNTKCTVTIRNADRASLPVLLANPFPEMQVRYIILPRTIFENLNINWDDYMAVAQALNI